MKPRLSARWLATLTGAAALLIAGAALAADVHVMISAGFFQAYSALAPTFERASGHRLVTTRGEAEIGFQQVSELIDVPGVSFVGPIPAELQEETFFSAAIAAAVKEREAAGALIRFLASPEAASAISKTGLAPLAGR